ncbi:hypothetical protein LIER_12655 [Lithospermum erythrorhizon]|uniref:Uncharacterized protein n=1 Tax=Lithospermum erythrorhizon TaxID=34254 RepID=A0AAV3PXS0_LITER
MKNGKDKRGGRFKAYQYQENEQNLMSNKENKRKQIEISIENKGLLSYFLEVLLYHLLALLLFTVFFELIASLVACFVCIYKNEKREKDAVHEIERISPRNRERKIVTLVAFYGS